MIKNTPLKIFILCFSLIFSGYSFAQNSPNIEKENVLSLPISEEEKLDEKTLFEIGPNEIIAISNELIELLQDNTLSEQERKQVTQLSYEIGKLAFALRDTVILRNEAPIGVIFGIGADLWVTKLANATFQGSFGILVLKTDRGLNFFLTTLAGPGLELGRIIGPLSKASSQHIKQMISGKTMPEKSDDSDEEEDSKVTNTKKKYDPVELSFPLFSGGVIFGNIGEDNKVITKASDILGGAPYIGIDYENSSRLKWGGGLFVRPELGKHYISNDSKTLLDKSKDVALGLGQDSKDFAIDVWNATKDLDKEAAWKSIKKRSSAAMILIYGGLGTKTPHVKVQGQSLFLNTVGDMSSVDEAFFKEPLPYYDPIRALRK